MPALDTTAPPYVQYSQDGKGITHVENIVTSEDFDSIAIDEVFPIADYEFSPNPPYLSINKEESVRLLRPIRVQSEGENLVINDWGLEMTVEESKDVTGVLARRYFEMYSGGIDQSVPPEEEEYYLHIQDCVDDTEFRIGRTPPRYFEVELLNKKPLQLSIAGQKTTIQDRSFKDAFEIFNVGEIIGCDLTFDKDRKLKSVSNTRIINYSDQIEISDHVPTEEELKLAESIKEILPAYQK